LRFVGLFELGLAAILITAGLIMGGLSQRYQRQQRG
jgi:hypothetical protein